MVQSIPSPQLVNRLKTSEGFEALPYLCPTGHVSIGYGHNLEARPQPLLQFNTDLFNRVKAGGLKGRQLLNTLLPLNMAWDRDFALSWLIQDIQDTARELIIRVPQYVQLVDRGDLIRAEVLIDMAFNMGVAGLLNFRKMLGCLQADDYSGAAAEMLDSTWAHQVKGRATKLAEIMRTGRA